MNDTKGKLYGISVGPGNPELITIKAVRLLNECHVLAAPRTSGMNAMALSIALQAADLAGKEILYVDFLMSREKAKAERNYRSIAGQLVPYLEKGRTVGMLSIGDISIYSTFSSVADIIRGAGYETETCAGVPSFCEIASKIGIPLVSGKETLLILPGEHERLKRLEEVPGTRILMKSGDKLEEILRYLKDNGLETSAYLAKDCGLETERIVKVCETSSVESGYFTTLIYKT